MWIVVESLSFSVNETMEFYMKSKCVDVEARRANTVERASSVEQLLLKMIWTAYLKTNVCCINIIRQAKLLQRCVGEEVWELGCPIHTPA